MVTRIVPKRLFYSAVFQRVKTDDRDTPTHADHLGQPLKHGIQRPKLVIDGNSQGLERPGRRVNTGKVCMTSPGWKVR